MISSTTEGMSTGPVIAVTITAILGISMSVSPKNGYLSVSPQKTASRYFNEINTISGENSN